MLMGQVRWMNDIGCSLIALAGSRPVMSWLIHVVGVCCPISALAGQVTRLEI
jgi:hypothetical protein